LQVRSPLSCKKDHFAGCYLRDRPIEFTRPSPNFVSASGSEETAKDNPRKRELAKILIAVGSSSVGIVGADEALSPTMSSIVSMDSHWTTESETPMDISLGCQPDHGLLSLPATPKARWRAPFILLNFYF
jgi:hypothetical protein